MSFYKKYELDRLIADGEARTFRAIETASGRAVFLHLFNPSGQPLLATLKSQLGGTAGRTIPPLIEIGEFAGSPYAVTEAIEPFRNLRDWISTNVGARDTLAEADSDPVLAIPAVTPPPLPAAVPPPNLVSEAPGDFTSLFRDSEPAAPPPKSPRLTAEEPSEFTRLFEPAAPPLPPPPVARQASGGLVADEPGEFTRLFEPPRPVKPARPVAPVTPIAPAPSAVPGGLVADPGGEFTRLFEPAKPAPPLAPPERTPEPPPPAAWQPPPPPERPAEMGEFTRLFGSRLPGEAIDIEKEHASAARNAPPESKPFQAAGEFTRMFGPEGVKGAATPARPAQPPPSLNTRPLIGSASGMFGDPEELSRIAAEALSANKPEADNSPGEYTKFFEKPKAEQETPKAAEPVKPVPEAVPPRKSNRDLIVIVAAVLVLVALIVAAILLRH